MENPVVFISYSHDSSEHKLWVSKLATDLRANSVDAILDQWDLSLGQDVTAFMQHGIADSDRVLLICSDAYVRKADGGAGGVGYERLVVTAELVRNIDTRKFVPLVRNNASSAKTPTFLGPRLFIDFSDDAAYQAKFTDLLRELLGAPGSPKPPLGPNPFSGTAPGGQAALRMAGPSGITSKGEPVLDDPWFGTQAALALEGIRKMQLNGHMELRFALHDAISKSQLDLLNAVRSSEIHTFGWPIGVTLENREEYRPRPTAEGIRAELAMAERASSGLPSYDYWAARNNGDFYLLQSLFEDQRGKNLVFFNTRIVRITESLLFAANLYSNLGVAPEIKVSIRIAHRGLSGRTITSSNPNRDVSPGEAHEDSSQTQLVEQLGVLRERLVADVRQVAEPLFMLFDFKQFNESVYADIVTGFAEGRVT
jgi:hypothetical protein